MMSLMAALAEFERSVIAERCSAGRKEARLKGARFGRTPGIDKNKIDAVSALPLWSSQFSSVNLALCRSYANLVSIRKDCLLNRFIS